MNSNYCVCCGEEIPEGSHICSSCVEKYRIRKDELRIKIKYHDSEIEKLCKIKQGDWLDMRAAETVNMKSGEDKLISLGVSMELPKGYEAHVVPRSSTYKNFGIILANSVGFMILLSK